MAAKKRNSTKKKPTKTSKPKQAATKPATKNSGNSKALKRKSLSETKKPAKRGATTSDGKSATEPTTDTKTQAPVFPIVGLGASAGGLEALEEFFRHMPTDSNMAFVVVMHQAAKHVSLLPELLAKHTKMRVVPIRNRMKIQTDAVYIVPPGKNVNLLDGTLHLTDLPEKHIAPLPIDCFFRSLAEERKVMAVAIVLSGTGTDGTVGLSAIKGESGMVMVQSIESAKFSGMPQNAIAAGWADYILPPKEMPAQLITYARGPFLKVPRLVDKPAPATQNSLPDILLLLRRRCGHDFSGYKLTTICRRIECRMNVRQIIDPKKYLRFLAEHELEAEMLFKELLIGVTSFFRDSWAFETLTVQAIIPLLQKKTADSTFRVWVPGCSTGEEAYSIAILLRESLDKLNILLDVQIFATDLDGEAIEAARTGLFPNGVGTDVSSERLEKFFMKVDGGYQIRKDLRDWVVFAPQNVIHDPPFTKLDLVSCRNLLIYLQADLQRKLITLFHYSLANGGAMFLGTSESIGTFTDSFAVLDQKAKLFCRRSGVTSPAHQVDFPITVIPVDSVNVGKRVATRTALVERMNDAVAAMLVSNFAPPTVIVDEQGEIFHVHGRTGQFLELAPGGPPNNIILMARKGLDLEISSALREATAQDGPAIRENVPVKKNGHTTLVKLTIQRIKAPESIKGLLRVSFEVLSSVAPPPAEEHKKVPAKSKQRRTNREKEVERELQQTRESLQRSIEELDASNEEMKSTNEELQSTNEALQSTNEELETSKEELQSLNEELQTVNAEYQDKNQNLSQANDDMNNLLNSTNIATIFLDSRLGIKRFTERAERIIHLIPTDVGRPLRDLSSKLRHEDLATDAQQVLKTLIFKEREVLTGDDHRPLGL